MIKIVHEHGPAQFAGQTDAEREASEVKFMQTNGASLTEEQLENRKKLIARITASYAMYRDWLEKDVDQLTVAGLEYQNNKSISMVVQSAGGGTQHSSMRQRYAELTVSRPYALKIRNVTGAVNLRFGRMQLELSDIAGLVNVQNDFGDTRFTATNPMLDTAHRIISQSGRIDVELSPAAWESLPVVVATNHGGVSTNFPQKQFATFMISGTTATHQVNRDWSGFRTVAEGEDPFGLVTPIFGFIDRLGFIANNKERSSGLDIISRSGRIAILKSDP